MKEKSIELKETRIDETNNLREKDQKYYNTRALRSAKDRHTVKRKADTKSGKFGTKTENRTIGNLPCRFCNAPNPELVTNTQLSRTRSKQQQVRKKPPPPVCKSLQTKIQQLLRPILDVDKIVFSHQLCLC